MTSIHVFFIVIKLIFSVGEDFDFPTGGFDIPAGTNRGCLEISIIPSDVVEGEERIELILADTTPMTLRDDPVTTTVTIASDGGTYRRIILAHTKLTDYT